MRWQIQGTDSLTGQAVELALEEADASAAVRTAHDRHIVVEKITRSRGGLRWLFGFSGWILFFATLLTGAWFFFQYRMEHDRVQQALVEQSRFAHALSAAEHLTAELRRSDNLGVVDSEKARQLAEELSAARSRMSLSEKQLSAAHQQLEKLERAATSVPALESQVAALQVRAGAAEAHAKDADAIATRLATEMLMKNRRIEQLQIALEAPSPAVARAQELEKQNRQLAEQIELLKGEMLVLAATSRPAEATEASPPPPQRTALALPYEAARDFLLLAIDHTTLATRSTDEFVTTYGSKPENAVTIQFTHSTNRDRVFSAELSLSLAPDAPKDKLAQNTKVVADFLRLAAPNLKDIESIGPSVAASLARQNASRQLSFNAPECTLTVHNDGMGTYTFHVEPVR